MLSEAKRQSGNRVGNPLGPLLKWIKHRFPKPAIPVQVRVAPPSFRRMQPNLKKINISA
jgi:hypothetical protein